MLNYPKILLQSIKDALSDFLIYVFPLNISVIHIFGFNNIAILHIFFSYILDVSYLFRYGIN
ncbi:hypothetical protein CKY06_24165 [Photorhabdus sp. S15-56]|nr:hypothetical protein CKY14_23940 [Photorhabdus sp. S14-60]RAW69101.1 hypothetical protein CKY06_24165 [Photorhabdus sp. S15-56]